MFVDSFLLHPDEAVATKMSFSITKDFTDFLKHGDELCDATLVSSSDGSSITVHKFVLAARSAYFKTAFFGELSSDTAKLHFEEDVLEAIKTYCYTDSVGDIFGDSYQQHQSSDTVTTTSVVQDCSFLVRLAVAADYLLLPGLQRLLWEVTFRKLRFSTKRHLLFAPMYSEAKAMGAEDLRVLAWHAYWMYQQQAEEDASMEKIETDPPLFEDHLLTSDVNYKGMGIILLLGCSEDGVNGEYYGFKKFRGKNTNLSYEVFKKDRDETISLSITRTFDKDNSDRSEDCYTLRYVRVKARAKALEVFPCFLHRMNRYDAASWDCDETAVFDKWTMESDDKQKVGAKIYPPMSFTFRF